MVAPLLAVITLQSILLAAATLIGLVLVTAGRRVVAPTCTVAGALAGWFVGSAVQAVFAPHWPWLACAIGGATLGAVLAILGLRLFLGGVGACLGALVGLVIGAVAIQHGAVPAVDSLSQASRSEDARDALPPSASAANATPLLRAFEVSVGGGALLETAFRGSAAWRDAGEAAMPASWVQSQQSVSRWYGGLSRPEATVLVGCVAVGSSVGFLLAILFSTTATAVFSAVTGSYLLVGAGALLLAREVPTAPAITPPAWWSLFAALAIIGCAYQLRGASSAPSSPSAKRAPRGRAGPVAAADGDE